MAGHETPSRDGRPCVRSVRFESMPQSWLSLKDSDRQLRPPIIRACLVVAGAPALLNTIRQEVDTQKNRSLEYLDRLASGKIGGG